MAITGVGYLGTARTGVIFFKFQQSYGDLLLYGAPDISSRPRIGRLNIVSTNCYVERLGGYLLAQADYLNTFFSHDKYI